MSILDAMRRSATKYTTPDDRVGYGIPDMKKAFTILLRRSYTQQANLSGCTANVELNVKQDNTMTIVIERKQSGELVYTPFQTIAGTDNFTNRNINFTDDLSLLTSGGIVNYRFKLSISTDTTFALDSIAVNVPATCVTPVNLISVTPNPVTDKANIIISRAAAAKIGMVVINSAGRRVYANTYQQPVGTQIKTIDFRTMSAGVYFITVFGDDKKLSTVRIVKR